MSDTTPRLIKVSSGVTVALRLAELRCALRRRGLPATSQSIAAAVLLAVEVDAAERMLRESGAVAT